MPSVYLLTEQLRIERDPLRAGIIRAILERANIMETLPFQTTGKLNIKVTRWKVLPQPQWRNLNDSFTSTTGTTEQLEETVYIAGGNIDIERQFTDEEGTIVDPRENQLEMFMAAMSYFINEAFVNADQAVDPKQITGLKVRVGNLPARQTISASAAAGGLDVRLSEANEHTFLDKLDEALDKVENGQADVILCNTNTRLGLRSVLRRLKLYDTTRDMFDREVMTYRGARILDMGPTLAGAFTDAAASQIITQTEAPTGGGASQATSLYCVRFGRDGGQYLHGWDKHKLKVTDIGLLDNAAQKRTNIEWPWGLALFNPRSVTRLKDVAWAT